MEIPLARAAASPRHISSDYYYRMPVRPIYKSYPVYRPDKEPAEYLDSLKKQEPEVVFDASTLNTKEKIGSYKQQADSGRWIQSAR